MFRNSTLLSLAAVLAVLSLPAEQSRCLAAQPKAPNIVFILADDLGYGDPKCFNPESKVPTPNMDRLAGEGMRFTDAHSGSAVCTPTRYGILTGRYCWRTRLQRGVLLGYDPPLVEPGRLTVASLLRKQGYRTACVGKWHLGLGWAKKDPGGPAGEANVDFSQPFSGGPLTLGFDYYFGISASLDMPPYVFLENDRAVAVPSQRVGQKAFGRAGLRAAGFEAVDVLPTLTRKAVELLDAHAAKPSDKPLFLYLALTAPHTPVAPAKPFLGRSQAGRYGDFVAQTDASVGEVLRALERNKLAQDTLVIVTSDNGSTNPVMTQFNHRPNGPWRGRKSDAWEGGHRIPFIARWPGKISPGTKSEETIWLGDLMATCAAVVGAELPPGAGEDSVSILPALLGEKRSGPLHEAVIHHSINGMFAVRQGQWKLILGRGSGGWSSQGNADDPPGQLYDVQHDPGETANLYERHPEVVARLTALLEKYRK